MTRKQEQNSLCESLTEQRLQGHWRGRRLDRDSSNVQFLLGWLGQERGRWNGEKVALLSAVLGYFDSGLIHMICMNHTVGSLGPGIWPQDPLPAPNVWKLYQCQMDSKNCCAIGSRRGQRQATCSGHTNPESGQGLSQSSVAQVQVVVAAGTSLGQ